MVQHCEALNRSVQVVNLDPAAEHFNYPVMAGESCTASPGTESGLLSPEGVCSWEAARGGDISESDVVTPPTPLRRVLHLNLETSPSNLPSSTPQHWSYRHVCAQLFTWVLEFHTQVLMLVHQALFISGRLPSPTDIRELIEVDDVMEDSSLRFGPNGGLVFCMEYFANNFDWLENCLGHVEDDYILFDCPGQIELYTHLPVMKQLVQQLEQWEFRVCGVFLVDSQFMVESFKFISGILAALSAMISLEIPQVNIMTKMDLLSKKAKKEIEKFLDPDLYSLLEDSTGDLRSQKFKKLTKAVCGLIDDYSMVRFLPYDQSDEESMSIVLQHIDFAIQYGEDLEFKEPKEQEEESSSMFDEYFQERQNE
ncbi:GPN-loop GTPase 3 isoform X2 [Cricetulus griseus]|nr:GPN-loop GTPase 3 isoform X2 [Cricetulus griseus]XP_035302937.1 GPN-loop GTPase 3 isoform X2 [Cricetulus griseus]